MSQIRLFSAYFFRHAHAAKRFAFVFGVGASALVVSGCGKSAISDITGSIRSNLNGASAAMPTDEGELRRYSEDLGQKYESNRKNKQTAINYARSLRALGQNTQAVAVMQALAAQYPRDMEVLGAYGKALSDSGNYQQAARVLENAHTPERPNWSILSSQGTVADQMGNHEAAQQYYNQALQIRPNDPSVLSNLGLSYALAHDLPQAEKTLRQAADQPQADMRVRQNLALVLALEGKFNESEEVSRTDLSAVDAATNVASIRRMISQSDTWSAIQKYDRKSDKPNKKKDAAAALAEVQ